MILEGIWTLSGINYELALAVGFLKNSPNQEWLFFLRPFFLKCGFTF